jgi:hypothetical protein
MEAQEYVRTKSDELKRWERELETKGHELTAALGEKRDEVVKRLEGLKVETGERWDVLRMGFESAWQELKTAFETVASKDLDAKH